MALGRWTAIVAATLGAHAAPAAGAAADGRGPFADAAVAAAPVVGDQGAPGGPAVAVRGSAEVLEETLDGARIALARPPGEWNRRLLVIASDWRPDGSPLDPDLHAGRPFVRGLLGAGWAVAATGGHREGAGAMEVIGDLEALRRRVAALLGDPEMTLVEGDGFGGLVAVRLAEEGGEGWSGALAVDPALGTRDRTRSEGVSLQPRRPLLILAGRDARRGALAYVEARLPRPEPFVAPALFVVGRDGACAVGEAERAAGLHALERWLAEGRASLPSPAPDAPIPYFDATLAPDPGPSTARPLPDGAAGAGSSQP